MTNLNNNSIVATTLTTVDKSVLRHALIAAIILSLPLSGCEYDVHMDESLKLDTSLELNKTYQFILPEPSNLIDLNQSVELPSPASVPNSAPIGNNNTAAPTKPVANQPATSQPVVNPPLMTQPVTNTPVISTPVTEMPNTTATPIVTENPSTPAVIETQQPATEKMAGNWLSVVDYSSNQNLYLLDPQHNKILIGKLVNNRFESVNSHIAYQDIRHRSIQSFALKANDTFNDLYTVENCQSPANRFEKISLKNHVNRKGTAVFLSSGLAPHLSVLASRNQIKKMQALFEPQKKNLPTVVQVDENNVTFPMIAAQSQTLRFSKEQFLSDENISTYSISDSLKALIESLPEQAPITLMTEHRATTKTQWVRLQHAAANDFLPGLQHSLGVVTSNGVESSVNCLYASDTLYPADFSGQQTQVRSVRYQVSSQDKALNWDIQYHQINDLKGKKLYSLENFWNISALGQQPETLDKTAEKSFNITASCALQSRSYMQAAGCVKKDYMGFQKEILSRKISKNLEGDIFYANLMRPNTLFNAFDINKSQHMIDFKTLNHSQTGSQKNTQARHSINLSLSYSF